MGGVNKDTSKVQGVAGGVQGVPNGVQSGASKVQGVAGGVHGVAGGVQMPLFHSFSFSL